MLCYAQFEEGCVPFLVYRRWQERDEEDWLDAQADKWFEDNFENPAGMAIWCVMMLSFSL